VVAIVKDSMKDDPAKAANYVFVIGACILALGLIVSLGISDKPFEKKA
jgi:hypothetical protein